MMKICLIGLGVVLGAIVLHGCSEDDRAEISDRVLAAGKALSGEVGSDGERPAKIVCEQQRKERIRQDTKWTAENRALHPIEYCQAQLEELDCYAKKLEVSMHEVAVNQSKVKREIGESEAMVKHLSDFLAEAKSAYKTSESSGSEKVLLGGFSVSRENAKGRIVEVARKIPQMQTQVGTLKNFLVKLNKKADVIANAQKKIVENRELVQRTISNLKLKKVIDGEQGIRDALNAINDNMASLGEDYDSPTLDEVIQPTNATTIDDEFRKLMSK